MNKLAILVPYRDREQHLKKFAPHMSSFLKSQGIDYSIYIIEQLDDKPFNRAKLLNVGFLETKEEHDYFCFHDIDMLPSNKDCDYSFIDGACRLSHFVSQFNFVPRPPQEFGGGVVMINKESFENVNGFSNNYWGWGLEDNDFSTRCRRKGVKIEFREGRYFSLHHEPNGDTNGKPPSIHTINNRNYFKEIVNSPDFFVSGLTNIEYEKIDQQENDFYTVIKVKL